MEPYQERVVDEKNALDIKISALREYLRDITISRNISKDYNLLCEQLYFMERYSLVLEQRIIRFEK